MIRIVDVVMCKMIEGNLVECIGTCIVSYPYLIPGKWKELVGQLQDILPLELGFLPTCRVYPIPIQQNWRTFFHLFHPLSLPIIFVVSTVSDPRLVSVIAASLLLNTPRSSSTLLLDFDQP